MSFSFLEEAAVQYWRQLDTPISRELTARALAGDWVWGLRLKVDPRSYTDAETYGRDNAAVCFLKKNPYVRGLSPNLRKEAAVATWREAELQCYKTNQRFAELEKDPATFGSFVEDFMSTTSRILRELLGTSISDDEVHQNARFGPGTTFESSVPKPTAADKYGEPLNLTHDASWYLFSLAGTRWFAYHASRATGISYSRGNRFTTVPKTAVTDRSIAIECSVNVYFQLAVGTVIRKRLKSNIGLDLDHAATHHRKMARAASIDGTLATIDLSSASDTLATGVVNRLLRGTLMLDRLNDLRSKSTFINGRWRVLEKFSSMGNGYTFELETAVFLSICLACYRLHGVEPRVGVNVSVFGDDIIVVKELAPTVVAALRLFGFSCNSEKTFLDGPFRESCGGDFFLGRSVRGYYLKKDLKRDSEEAFGLHNGARRTLQDLGFDSPWFCSWVRESLLTPRLRDVGGSERLGDTVLHGVKPEWVKWKRGIRWVSCVSWREPIQVGWNFFDPEIRLTCRLTSYGSERGITARGVYNRGWRKVRVSDS